MIEPKPYVDYLDKEMTIMGLLSAFSVAFASFATDRIVSSGNAFLSNVWQKGSDHVMLGAVTALLAALFFYLQRSLLAWYYGQICLAHALHRASPNSVADLLHDADGWDTWVRYQAGFAMLTLSFASYAYAIAKAMNPAFNNVSSLWVIWLPVTLTVVVVVVRWSVLTKFKQEEDPFVAWAEALRGK